MYRQVPIGVVVPRTYDDVIATVALCRKFNAPIFGRGCGTSLAGQCCNTAVVIDFSKYLNKILEINPKRKYAWVEPGLILDTLQSETKKFHLMVGPDPATHEYCTLGGMIGNNSCGVHSVVAGRTEDNVEELDVLTYDGLRRSVGPPSESPSSGNVGGAAKSIRSLRASATATLRKYERAFRIFRAACPATIFPSCFRRTAFMWPALWSEPRARAPSPCARR
ncbi:MAG TPA: FAD-dependent oxidoreductase [Bryobacteraceae bacterium]